MSKCDRGQLSRVERTNLSQCRFCYHYQPQGRRGGVCQLLAVPVKGNWKACSLSAPVFP